MHISKLDHRFDYFEERWITLGTTTKANQKEREKFDDYEMLEEYDFSDGVRGRFYEPKKLQEV